METVSIYLVNKLLDRGIINSDKTEICKSGMELIMADITNFSAVLIIGALAKSFIYGCIYLLLFWTVRRFSGGFHAKTYGVCRTATIGIFILIVLISRIINNNFLLYSLSCNAVAFITILLFAPVRHPNKELTDKEVQANKLFSLVATLLFTIISTILVIFERKEGLFISLTLFAIAVLMYVGMLTNGKEVEYNDENQ